MGVKQENIAKGTTDPSIEYVDSFNTFSSKQKVLFGKGQKYKEQKKLPSNHEEYFQVNFFCLCISCMLSTFKGFLKIKMVVKEGSHTY